MCRARSGCGLLRAWALSATCRVQLLSLDVWGDVQGHPSSVVYPSVLVLGSFSLNTLYTLTYYVMVVGVYFRFCITHCIFFSLELSTHHSIRKY